MTTTTAVGDGRGAIEIGGVIQDTFRIIGRNFVSFLLLSLLLTALPAAVFGYFNLQMATDDMSGSAVAMLLAGGLIAMVAGVVLQGTIVHGTVMDMNGRKAAISESLAVGLRNFLALIAIAILLAIAVTLGFILLIVPGVIMALAWSVVVPAYIAERIGIFEAFSRSAQLTRGNRWRILLLALLLVFGYLVISFVVTIAAGLGSLVTAQTSVFYAVVVSPIITALYGLVGSVGAAVLYANLRRAKEGLTPDSLAAIFD